MLDTTVLYNALVKLGRPPTPFNSVDAANRLAAAYNEYATGAVAGIVPATPTGAEVAAMSACLIPAMVPLTGNALTLANAISAGITAYWSAGAATFFAGGVTTPPVGAAVLTTALLPILLVPAQPLESWATAMSTATDVCTRTTAVTFPGTPPVVVTVA